MSKILLELASKHTSHLSLNTQTLQQFPQASNPLLSCVPGHALSSLPIQQSFSVEQLNKGLHDSDSTSISKKLSIFQFPNSHYMSYRTYLQIKDLFIVLLHVLPIFFFQILTEKSNITISLFHIIFFLPLSNMQQRYGPFYVLQAVVKTV
jgi:hypothetical protein